MTARSLDRPFLAALLTAIFTMTITNPSAPPAFAQGREYEILDNRTDRLIVRLPNRMIVVAQELRTAPVVSAQIWVKTGSIFEQEHVGAGLSHYLEHLVAGGTTRNRTEGQTKEILGRMGARTNAATGLDAVHYYINTTAAHTIQAVELLSDWLRFNIVDVAEFEREREVIQKEFAMGRGEPGRILWKLTQQARYTTHPARHPTIGYLDQFMKVTREQVLGFYRRMYVPNNMVFVVVGDIDRGQVVNHIAGLWENTRTGALPRITFPREKPVTDPVELSGEASIHAPRLRLAWRGTKLSAEGDYALDMLAGILGHGESSRLVQTVRDQQRRVNTIAAFNASFDWGEGFFGVDAEVVVDPAQAGDPQAVRLAVEQAKAAILEQVEQIRNEPPAAEELSRARRQTLAQVVYSAQTAEGLAERLARDVITTGDPDYLKRYVRELDQVTAEDVRDAARRFLDPSGLITITLMPAAPGSEPADIARTEDLTKHDTALAEPFDLDNSALVEKMRQALERQYEQAARPGAIVVEEPHYLTLPNGLRVILGRTTTVPAVAIQFYHLGGLLSDYVGEEGISATTAQMQMRGTKTRTALDIHQQTEGLGAALSSGAGNNSWFVHAMCLKEDWQTILELVQDVAMNPTFPDDEWERVKPRLIAGIRRQKDNWHGELLQNFRETYFAGHPWAAPPLGRAEAVEKLSAEDLRTYHMTHLGADEAVLAIFGDIDVDEVAARVRELFGGMAPKPLFPFSPLSPSQPRARLVTLKTDKPLGAAQIGFGLAPARADADYPTMQVLSKVLSSFPSGRLDQALRGEREGLVYAVGAGVSTGLAPGYFAVLYNSDPAQVERAFAGATLVLKSVRQQEVDDATLARAKAAVLTDRFFSEQTGSDRAAHAALLELYGMPRDEREKFIQKVTTTTPGSLMDVARKYLVNRVAVVMSSGDLDQAQLEQALIGLP